jgi:hypothetical protein
MMNVAKARALREEALADLHAVAGGVPLCRMSANGIQGQEAKYFEGRYAALTEVIHGGSLESCLATWQEQLVRSRQGRASRAWQQYFGGGADALMELVQGAVEDRD